MSFDNPGIDSSSLRRKAAMEKQLRQLASQATSQENFMISTEEGNQYITAMIEKEMRAKAKTLEQRSGKDKPPEGDSVFGTEEVDVLTYKQEELNPELDVKTLLILKEHLGEGDTPSDILRKVLEVYPDYSLADDALDYLEKISDMEVIEQVRQARSDFNEHFGREIVAGKNISLEARNFAAEGLGTPTGLRDLYRDITGTERTPNQLFEELAELFPFEKLKKVIKFLLNSLGRDLKAKGSSIPKPLLFRLLTESRNLQAILALYLFFQGRMNIIYRGFDRNELYYPEELTFDLMARLFMEMIEDRYPSAVKVIKLAKRMKIEDEVIAQIFVFSQFRDAIRNVAPKLYRNNQHRQELLNAYMDALEELDEALGDEYDEVDNEEG